MYKWEHYIPIYESAFTRFITKNEQIRLLEIGVQNGGSLQIWSKYLPRGSKVVGIDIDPACANLLSEPGTSIHIGDGSCRVSRWHTTAAFIQSCVPQNTC